MKSERWRPVYGYEGRYEVSDHGRVRSLRTNRILKPSLSVGYPMVSLFRNKKDAKSVKIHRLVLEAFTGFHPKGMRVECGHKDGSRTNNRLENLYWITRSGNCQDKYKHGTMPMGPRHWRTQLTDKKVLEIYRRANTRKETLLKLATEFGVSQCHIAMIRDRKTWKHLLANRVKSADE